MDMAINANCFSELSEEELFLLDGGLETAKKVAYYVGEVVGLACGVVADFYFVYYVATTGMMP